MLRQPRLDAGINHLIFEVEPTIIEHVNALALGFDSVTCGFAVSGFAGEGEGGVDGGFKIFPGCKSFYPLFGGDLRDIEKTFYFHGVAGDGAGGTLARAVLNGVIPALILGAKATVHDAVHRASRGRIGCTALVECGLEDTALAFALNGAEALREPGVIKINPDLLHNCPPV